VTIVFKVNYAVRIIIIIIFAVVMFASCYRLCRFVGEQLWTSETVRMTLLCFASILITYDML